jgi:hypothetical protein
MQYELSAKSMCPGFSVVDSLHVPELSKDTLDSEGWEIIGKDDDCGNVSDEDWVAITMYDA